MKTLDKMHKEILDRIIDLKNKHNLTDKEFGIKTGVGEKAIDNWKRGMSASFMKKIDIIADFFNVSADYLLTGNDEQKEKPATDSDRLTEEEKQIIDLLRKVPEEDRKMLVGMIEGALRSRGLLK